MHVVADIFTGQTKWAEVMFIVATVLAVAGAIIAGKAAPAFALTALAIGFIAFAFLLL